MSFAANNMRCLLVKPHFYLSCLLFVCIHLAAGQDYRQSGSYPSATPLFGVTYSPFALRSDTMCLTVAQVTADMRLIRDVADHVRLYSLNACPELTETIMQFAGENGMRVIPCAFLSGDAQGNRGEMDALRQVIERYGDIIDAVLVGNEVLFGRTVELDTLLGYIREAKDMVAASGFSLPVSTSDVWPVYESAIGPRLVEATDFVCMNMQPFWEGWDIICPTGVEYECLSAGRYVHAKAEGLEGYFNKPVWVCESGWPTEGERCCEGRANARDGLLAGPSEANATIFLDELVHDGRAANRPTYIHAMFDENWKRIWSPCGTCEGLSTLLEDPSCSTCEVDYHFGIYSDQRAPKPGVQLPERASSEI